MNQLREIADETLAIILPGDPLPTGAERITGSLRYSDRVIYSPAVPVFRDDKGELLAQAYQAAFLTAAAPNLGAIVSNQPDAADSVPLLLRARAQRVLDIAAAHGHRTIVLGARGCGVFRNDPAVVACAFADAVHDDGRFDRIVFAVYDRLAGAPVLSAFSRAFAAGS